MNSPRPSPFRGFTLLELLLAVAILALLITLLADTIVRTQDTVGRASAQVTEFQQARSALDAMSFALSQATLDAFWTYRRNASSNPTGYERSSDHHFILGPAATLIGNTAETGQAVFFQTPMGYAGSFSPPSPAGTSSLPELEHLHTLLNCWGFYIAYGSDLTERPAFLQSNGATTLNPERHRFRLMQYAQPAEKSILYSSSFALNQIKNQSQALEWFRADLTANSRPVADNILALILVPYATNVTVSNAASGYSTTKIEPDSRYSYDSRDFQWNGSSVSAASRRHQLPPRIQITLIAAEERSYQRFIVSQKDNPDSAAAVIRKVLKDRFVSYSQYETDLSEVSQGLNALHLHHKLLTTTVALRSGKWITEL